MALESHGSDQPPVRQRVLVIDDDFAVRQVLSAHLEQRNHEVVAVGTKAAALAALATSRFDVVVTDVLLPDGDGIDILNYVSAREVPERLVCVTGGGRYFGPAFFRRVAEALGAFVLQKPFGREVFVAAVEGRAVPVE